MTYQTLSDEHRQAVRRTIMHRLQHDGIDVAAAQRDRIARAADNMAIMAEKRAWGDQWPGDAARSYEDMRYYVAQFDILRASYEEVE